MSYAECVISDEEVKCSNGVSVEGFNGVIRIRCAAEAPVVFSSSVDVKVLCSGLDFQTHTWGLERKTIWLLEKGLNICLAVKDAVLERYNSFFVVKKNFEEWGPPLEALNYLKDRYLSASPAKPLILLSPSFNVKLCFKNIVTLQSIRDLQVCLEESMKSVEGT